MVDFFLELGILLIFALIGGVVATRLKQSSIIGYLVIGVILAEISTITIFGVGMKSVISYKDPIIQSLSQIGLVMLLFFIGLNISPSKFKKRGKLALMLALIDLAIVIFSGFVIGMIFRWDLPDTIFLAFIISQSSIIITAKSIDDLRKLTDPETETLLGLLIIEDFISIILVFIANGFMVTTSKYPGLMTIETVGLVATIGFFLAFVLLIVPFLRGEVFKAKNDELFVLFTISIVFIVSSFVNVFGITPAIGAFFVGMIFAETEFSKEFETKLSPIKYAFAAIFFVTFGMASTVAQIFGQWQIIMVVVIFIVVDEVLLLSAFAYLFGFSPKSSVLIGSGSMPRAEGSVIFANIANSIFVNSGGTVLLRAGILIPITSGLCIVTSIVTPILMKSASFLSRFFSRALPAYLKYSGSVISRTLKPIFFPKYIPLRKTNYSVLVIFLLYLALVVSLLFARGLMHDLLYVFTIPVLVLIWWAVDKSIFSIVYNTRYSNIGMNLKREVHIKRIVDLTLTIFTASVIVVIGLWINYANFAIIILFILFFYLQVEYYYFYRSTSGFLVS